MATKSQVKVEKKAMTASSDKGEDDDDVGVFLSLQGVLAEEGGGGGCSGRKQMSLLSPIIELILGREHL
eukprot:scaffold25914_cov148-Skeletonema_dohrnii-CCMP3373.AAC.2